MKQLVKRSKKKYINLNNLFSFFLIFIIISIVINPAKYSSVTLKGLEVWVKILVPSLFPFFVLTKLFSSTSFIDDFTKIVSPLMKKIYKCPAISSYIFLMSIITGYPFGAKLVADNFNNGYLSKNDAIKTLSFCSNSGPMFILGSVGIGMFVNQKLGLIIYFSHIIGALINGFLYRNYSRSDFTKNTEQESQYNNKQRIINFSESITSSISSIMLIGGVICFSFVLVEAITSNVIYISIINSISKLGINSNIINSIFAGIFEITKGCLMLSNIPLSFNFQALICCFIISLGGISTFLQSVALTKDIIPAKIFILEKFTHALCSTFVCSIFLLLL